MKPKKLKQKAGRGKCKDCLCICHCEDWGACDFHNMPACGCRGCIPKELLEEPPKENCICEKEVEGWQTCPTHGITIDEEPPKEEQKFYCVKCDDYLPQGHSLECYKKSKEKESWRSEFEEAWNQLLLPKAEKYKFISIVEKQIKEAKRDVLEKVEKLIKEHDYTEYDQLHGEWNKLKKKLK